MEATQEGGEGEEPASLWAGPNRTVHSFGGVAIQKDEFYKVIERDIYERKLPLQDARLGSTPFGMLPGLGQC